MINEYLKKHSKVDHTVQSAPRVTCADGFSMSVQAGRYLYSTPRENMAFPYTTVEVGFPSKKEKLLMEWAEEPEKPTDTVYGYVPVEVVDAVIEKHGGIAGEVNDHDSD